MPEPSVLVPRSFTKRSWPPMPWAFAQTIKRECLVVTAFAKIRERKATVSVCVAEAVESASVLSWSLIVAVRERWFMSRSACAMVREVTVTLSVSDMMWERAAPPGVAGAVIRLRTAMVDGCRTVWRPLVFLCLLVSLTAWKTNVGGAKYQAKDCQYR